MNPQVSRRHALAAAGALLAAPMINRGRCRLWAGGAHEYPVPVIDLVGRSLIIDMLGPLTISPSQMQKWYGQPETFTPADLAEFRGSGITAFHDSIGIGGPDAYLECLQYVGGINNFLAHHSESFKRIDTVADFDVAKKSGRIGVIIGVQDSEHFRKLDEVNEFYGLGQRVSQLTYNSRNLLGNGSTERRDDGLSDAGVAVVGRMNQVGMAVDVSHCGDRTTLDAFEVSKKPVLITHSNCRVLANGHPRCKSDEAIRKMAAQGGVMGITGVRMFVKATEPTTIEDVVAHFDHVRSLCGSEHLGIGSDMDLHGYDALPPPELKQLKASYKASYGFRERIDIEGLDHPKRVFDLTEALLRKGYSPTEVEGILGGNFRRVFGQIWKS